MNKLSIVIGVHNEGPELMRLLNEIDTKMKDVKYDWEVVIVDDFSTEPQTLAALDAAKQMFAGKITIGQHALNGDFAAHKNFFTTLCTGDWIFNLDADEGLPTHPRFIENIKLLIDTNPGAELFYLPRVNTVEGLTDEHIQQWGWQVNAKGHVNYPDYQGRLYKNGMQWAGKVHERIVANNVKIIPANEGYAIQHHKGIAKQEQQNDEYKKDIYK